MCLFRLLRLGGCDVFRLCECVFLCAQLTKIEQHVSIITHPFRARNGAASGCGTVCFSFTTLLFTTVSRVSDREFTGEARTNKVSRREMRGREGRERSGSNRGERKTSVTARLSSNFASLSSPMLARQDNTHLPVASKPHRTRVRELLFQRFPPTLHIDPPSPYLLPPLLLLFGRDLFSNCICAGSRGACL